MDRDLAELLAREEMAPAQDRVTDADLEAMPVMGEDPFGKMPDELRPLG